MLKKAYILIALVLGSLAIAFATTYLYLKREAMLEQRHRLLCEVLKPGMSKDEVVGVLRQVGDFTMSQGEWASGDIVLDIHFTDPRIRHRYGSFSVVFFDYKYERAVVPHGSDNPEIICDFYQATKSLTDPPKPVPGVRP